MAEKRNSHQEEAGFHTASESELLNGISYTGNKGPWYGTRHTIIIMMALGSAVSLTTKSIFSVIIVAMTTSNTSSNTDIPTYDDWNNKGVILSSVMWLGIPIQLIAGHWGKKYGHKWFIMGSVAANAILFMLIPAFAKIGGSLGVLICRFLEGGILGILSPISVGVNGLWVPAEERSKAGIITIAFAFLVGIVSYMSSGIIVSSSMGYPGCCYIIGGLNLVWCVAWYFLGHQSPATHPRITPEERKYIETSLNTHKTKDIPTPWLKMLTSMCFWAPVIGAVGINWIDTILSTVNLIYITKAWKIEVAESTTTVGVGPIVGLVVGGFCAPLSDFLIKKKYLRVVNARRIFHTVGIVGGAFSFLCMTWVPAGSIALIIANLSMLNMFTILFNVGGSGLNILDIAPTFAGIIGGFANTVSQCVALFAPMTIDWMLTDESDPAQWRVIFYTTGVIVTATAIFFDIFATDKRMWDVQEEEKTDT